MDQKLEAFQRILEILDRIRKECPWDSKQTNESLRPLTIEETYELSEALLQKNKEETKIELGDVLLHILFYSKIAEEKNEFNIADVCNSLSDKMVRRHPHVFGSVEANNPEQVERNWEMIKLKEGKNKTILGGVPASLPSLVKAYRIQDKARSAGFDWKEPHDVWEKVQEEIQEVSQEIENHDKDKMQAEFGDLLFSVINAARMYGIEPDTALERTNHKFIKRFNYLEAQAKANGKMLKQLSLEEMDALWEEAKAKFRSEE